MIRTATPDALQILRWQPQEVKVCQNGPTVRDLKETSGFIDDLGVVLIVTLPEIKDVASIKRRSLFYSKDCIFA